MIEVELSGLELHGFHGVEQEERAKGQRFLFDVRVGVDDAAASDQLEDTVDYRELAAVVRDVSDGHAYALLEALASAVVDALLDRFPIAYARVRVRKPDVRLDLPVEFSAATVERSRR